MYLFVETKINCKLVARNYPFNGSREQIILVAKIVVEKVLVTTGIPGYPPHSDFIE